MELFKLRSLMAAQVFAGLAGQLSNPSHQQVEALAKTAAEAAKAIEGEVWKISQREAQVIDTPTK